MFNANTASESCPVRIMYTETMTGDTIHASELDYRQCRWAGRPLALIKCTEFSDYSGGSVQRSNYRVILGDIEHRRPGIEQIFGSHGYQALAYDATLGPIPADDELCEMLDGVNDYALIDDDDHSELESELEAEAWDDYGREDFKREVLGVLALHDPDQEQEAPDDDAMCTVADCIDSVAATWGEFWWDLWRHGCDEFNVNGGTGYQVETGGGVHFHTTGWCDRAKHMERTNPSEARRRLAVALNRIAVACRVSE